MIPADQIEGKAAMFVEWEDRLTIFDALIICRFYRDLYQWEHLATIIKGATGLNLDTTQMRAIAAHISDITRKFNVQEGLTREDDLLPKRFHSEALPETGKVITPQEMDTLLQEYYRERGWDDLGRPLT
jgi:aldehyde:ferredoxin oxidoreductase